MAFFLIFLRAKVRFKVLSGNFSRYSFHVISVHQGELYLVTILFPVVVFTNSASGECVIEVLNTASVARLSVLGGGVLWHAV